MSRRVLATFALLLAFAPTAKAADDPKAATFPIWPEGAPEKKGDDPNLDVPTLTVFMPPAGKSSGASVIVCPGGGYGALATDYEGKSAAEWLNSLGVTAFVLKYRLGPRYQHPAMLHDAGRAIRTVRARAKEWDLDPKRVAILGFSAGGHLASTAGTHFDDGKADAGDPVERESSRPDRLILIYPVITMKPPYGHGGSRRNLLGDHPSEELVESLCNETQVTEKTPPTFIAHTNADTAVPPENALLFALALRKSKVPVELHLFELGQHGLGLGGGRTPPTDPDALPAFAQWPKLCELWLKAQGYLKKP